MIPNDDPEWKSLVALEPRLADLYNRARAIRDNGQSFCANETWRDGFRDELDELVGFHVRPDRHPRLRTWEAHNIARHTIYSALPDCRNCYCVDMRGILESSGRIAPKGRTRGV